MLPFLKKNQNYTHLLHNNILSPLNPNGITANEGKKTESKKKPIIITRAQMIPRKRYVSI